jgi:hypothetical protein
MKKAIVAVLFGLGICLLREPQRLEAQPIALSNRCCGPYNIVVCVTPSYAPVGTACFCPNQGVGFVC